MNRVLVSPPAEEPLTVAEAKLHLRIDEDQEDEDGLVDALISAARQAVEEATGRALITQTWKVFLDDHFPSRYWRDAPINLPLPPLQSVTHIKYYDSSGSLITLAGTEYFVDVPASRITLPYLKYWPATSYPRPAAVEVQYVTGYGDEASDVPPALRAAVKLMVGTLYEHREGIVVGTSAQELPQAVDFLLNPFRILAVA